MDESLSAVAPRRSSTASSAREQHTTSTRRRSSVVSNPPSVAASTTTCSISTASAATASLYDVHVPKPPKLSIGEATVQRANDRVRCQSASTARMNERTKKVEQAILHERPSSARTDAATSKAGAGRKEATSPTFRTQPSKGFRLRRKQRNNAGRGEDVERMKEFSRAAYDAALVPEGCALETKQLLESMLARGLARPPRGGFQTEEGQSPLLGSAGGGSGGSPFAGVHSGAFGSGDIHEDHPDEDQLRDAKYRFFVPTRLMVKKVEHRMDYYRTNPVERQLLGERVRRYKALASGKELQRIDPVWGIPIKSEQTREEEAEVAAEMEGLSLMEQYEIERQHRFNELHISPRDGPSWMARNATRHLHHKTTARRVWREELAHKKEVVGRHEVIKAEADHARERAELSIVASEWENTVAMASRGAIFLKNLFLLNLFNKLLYVYKLRKTYLRRWLVPVRRSMANKRRDYLQQRLRIACIAAWIAGKMEVKRKSVYTIKQFLYHLSQAGRFHIALTWYRKRIEKCQDILRAHLRYRTVRLNLLLMQWEHREEHIRTQLADEAKRNLPKKPVAPPPPSGSRRRGGKGAPTGGEQQHGLKRRASTVKLEGRKHQQLLSKLGGAGEDGGPENELVIQARINELVKNDQFTFDIPLPFMRKLKTIVNDWVARRKMWIKRDFRMLSYSDELEHERKMANWKKLSEDPARSPTLSPKPPAPRKRKFPLFLPADKMDRLIQKTYATFKEEVMDIRFTAATEVVREGKAGETDYVIRRDDLMNERFGYDVIEKRKFFADLRRFVFPRRRMSISPTIQPLHPALPPKAKEKISLFVPL